MPPAKKADKQASAPARKGAVERTVDSGKATLAFLQTNLRDYFTYIVKVGLVSMAVTLLAMAIAAVAIVAVVGLAFFTEPTQLSSLSLPVLALLVILGVVLFLAVAFITMALSAAMTAGTAEMMDGKPVPSIVARTKENFGRAAKYTLAIYAIVAVLFGVPVLSLFVPAIGPLLFLLLMVLAVIVLIVLAIGLQFSFWELVVARKGVWDSFRASFALVKSNLAAVLLYDVALFIIAMAVASVFSVIAQLVQLIAIPLLLVSSVVGLVAIFILMMVLGVAQSALINGVMLPWAYRFWKSLRAG